MDRDPISEAAWREYKLGEGMGGMVDGVHDTPAPPRWFQIDELGLGVGSNVSLHDTCAALATTNRRALRILGDDAPVRVTWPRDFDGDVEPPRRRPKAEPDPTFEDMIESLRRRLEDCDNMPHGS